MIVSPLSVDGLDLGTLRRGYAAGASAEAVVDAVFAAIASCPDPAIWICLRDKADVLADAAALPADRSLPLWGVPFAVKDNIDVAGLPTTAACPEFSFVPEQDATVVARLRAAGALLIGKTNLDQFATGLVGVRSPWGAPRSPFNMDYVSGGSSSGSAVAVSRGLVSFSLGTDTAGSGRVPAAFNNLVGLKPSRGLLSAAGVVPACRSLDCVSVFAGTADDAAAVLAVAAVPDAADPYSRAAPVAMDGPLPKVPDQFRFGVPRPDQIETFGDDEAKALFLTSVERLTQLGGTAVEVDLEPFLEVARLLYEGPWVAERYAAVGAFLDANPAVGHPVVRRIVSGGASHSAASLFSAMYRLEALRPVCDAVWSSVDVMVTPTAGTTYTVAEVEADPIRLNSRLGYYTNFMNLLDYAAVAVPAGMTTRHLPFGITLFGPTFSDQRLLALGDAVHRLTGLPLGATGQSLPVVGPRAPVEAGQVLIAVVGAHMAGLPLNSELRALGGRFVEATATAPLYRLYALEDMDPVRPGMVRVADGLSIGVELWSLSAEAFGRFVSGVASPLGIGHIQLADGRSVSGFLCEAVAVTQACDISAFGSWRGYLSDRGA